MLGERYPLFRMPNRGKQALLYLIVNIEVDDMNPVEEQAPSTNIIVPLRIESLETGPIVAEMTFAANLEKQYYNNADIRFKAPDASALRMKHIPVYAALRRRNGQWREIYDQDERFQMIGQVIDNPSWTVSPSDTSRILTATVVARLDLHFYDYIRTVRDRHLEFYDVVLELTGRSSVEPGYPRIVDGINQYGEVDFELSSFDAIYIVPKGGPKPDIYML